MSVRANDPDKLRYKFWSMHKWCAPRMFVWEDGVIHYDYVQGYHPTKVGPMVYAALERLWGPAVKCKVDTYLDYMKTRMPAADHELVSSYIVPDKLNGVQAVVGDCTFENIVINDGKVYFIDPGHARGLHCRELDIAKTIQSLRGWEHLKRPKVFPMRKPITFENYSSASLAIYITHLYRLLKHAHPKQCHEWALSEIRATKEDLLHRR